MAATAHRRRPHLTTLAIRRKRIVTIPEAIRQELDLHEGDHWLRRSKTDDSSLPDVALPTFERLASFLRDFDALTPSQKAAFLRAVVLCVADLRAGTGFRTSLRVKKMAGYDNVRELTWVPDGRATFEYAAPVKEGHPHVRWRRIGTYDIFKRP